MAPAIMIDGGVDVMCYNPPRERNSFNALRRGRAYFSNVMPSDFDTRAPYLARGSRRCNHFHHQYLGVQRHSLYRSNFNG
jgi:hypothetical protein